MEKNKGVGVPRLLKWVLGVMAAVALTAMVTSVVLDSQRAPTLVTPWGDISESSTRVSILP